MSALSCGIWMATELLPEEVPQKNQPHIECLKEDGGKNEDVYCVAGFWATSLGIDPRRRADRDHRWLRETPEESGPRRVSWNLLRHLRSQGGRYLPHVVLLAPQKKHCAGRKQGWRSMEQAGDRPWSQQK